jgi:hypothetical protein
VEPQLPDASADRQALTQLAYTYARHADRIEPDLLAALFVEDGVLHITRGAAYPPVRRSGRAEIAIAIARLDRYEKTFHLVANQLYDIDGDTATGEVYCVAHHVRADHGSRVDHVMMIRYLDQYRRETDGWRIVTRDLHVDWTEDRPVND